MSNLVWHYNLIKHVGTGQHLLVFGGCIVRVVADCFVRGRWRIELSEVGVLPRTWLVRIPYLMCGFIVRGSYLVFCIASGEFRVR